MVWAEAAVSAAASAIIAVGAILVMIFLPHAG
jgi:hypothetical protein